MPTYAARALVDDAVIDVENALAVAGTVYRAAMDPVEAAEVVTGGQILPVDLLIDDLDAITVNGVHLGAGAVGWRHARGRVLGDHAGDLGRDADRPGFAAFP